MERARRPVPLALRRLQVVALQDRRARSVRTAAGDYTIDVKRGQPSPALKLFGQGGPPHGQRARPRRPGPQRHRTRAWTCPAAARSASCASRATSTPGRSRWWASRTPSRAATPSARCRARRRSPASPGPPISPTPRSAAGSPARAAAASCATTCRDRVRQKVIFQEVTSSGASQTIGSTTRGGKGRIRFRSAPGGGRRKILAQFELDSIPAELKRVTTFQPQSIKLRRPRRLRVRRRGNSLRVSWRKVSGATRYEVGARLSGRRMTFKTTRRTKTTLRVPAWRSGRVYVRAVDGDLRQSGLARSRRFKAKGRQPSPFRPLLSCRVGGARIVCTEQNQRCYGRTATISASAGRRAARHAGQRRDRGRLGQRPHRRPRRQRHHLLGRRQRPHQRRLGQRQHLRRRRARPHHRPGRQRPHRRRLERRPHQGRRGQRPHQRRRRATT